MPTTQPAHIIRGWHKQILKCWITSSYENSSHHTKPNCTNRIPHRKQTEHPPPPHKLQQQQRVPPLPELLSINRRPNQNHRKGEQHTSEPERRASRAQISKVRGRSSGSIRSGTATPPPHPPRREPRARRDEHETPAAEAKRRY